MKMKKVFSSLMALGIVTTLTACGGSTDSATSTDSNEDKKAEKNADDKEDKKEDDKTAENTDGDEHAKNTEELENFEAQTSDDTLVIGSSEFSGDFLAGWQNSANDVVIRKLLGIEGSNGFNTMIVDENGEWLANSAVLEGEPETTDNKDGSRTFTFKIKPGLKWSDGEELTADDYIFSSLLFTHPEFMPLTGSINPGDLFGKGYEAYHSGESDTFEAVEKVDDHTFTYTIDSEQLPYYYEKALAAISAFPMHVVTENLALSEDGKKLIAKDGYKPSEEEVKAYKDSIQEQIDKANEEFKEIEEPADDASDNEKKAYEEEKKANDEKIADLQEKLDGDVDPTEQLIEQAMLNVYNDYRSNPSVVGGPYKFDEYNNNMVKLSLNPEYQGNFKGQKATIPNIIVQYVNHNIAVDLLENGDIDVWQGESEGGKIDKMKAAEDAGKIGINTFERNGYGSLNFLTDRGTTQYKEVRQAIAHLMDRNTFVQSYAGGYGVVTNGEYGLSQWMYKERGADLEGKLTNYQLNIDTANELLDKSPYKFEKDGKTAWDRSKAEEAFDKDADGFDYYRYNDKGEKLVVNQYGSEESPITSLMNSQLPVNAKQAGMEYNVTAGSFPTIQEYYVYPEEDAEYTSFSMAQSFSETYDPWAQFNSNGNDNKTRVNDPKADELTVKLRQTPPDDKEQYLDNWEEFQQWYNDYLPQIPLYSNLYHTGYTKRVEGFDVNTPSWGIEDQINAIKLK